MWEPQVAYGNVRELENYIFNYAQKSGFNLRVLTSEKNTIKDIHKQHVYGSRVSKNEIQHNKANGTIDCITYRNYQCEYGGIHKSKLRPGERQRSSGSKKIGCPYYVNTAYHKLTFTWHINRINLMHNHQLDAHTSNTKIINKKRELSAEQIEFFKSNYLAGIRAVDRLRLLGLGKYKLEWIDADVLRNLVQEFRHELGGGTETETQKFFDYCKTQQEENGASFFIQLDDQHRLIHSFFMSKTQREAAQMWPEVIEIDATCKTNRFGFQLVVFTGIDDEHLSKLFAIALVECEDIVNYTWVIDKFKTAIGEDAWGRMKVVFTDGEESFPIIFKRIMPHVHHQLCIWHISENVKKHCQPRVPDWDYFRNCWENTINQADVNDFEKKWKELLQISENKECNIYLNKLYEKKEKWAYSYNRIHCNFNIRSTQRVEGENAKIKSRLTTGTSLMSLVMEIEKIFTAELFRRRKIRIRSARKRTQENRSYLRPFLSEFAIGKLYDEFDNVMDFKITGERPKLTVIHKRDSTMVYNVTINDDNSCECSCNYPLIWLMPCRHVLSCNIKLELEKYTAEQFGRRWKPNDNEVAVVPPIYKTEARLVTEKREEYYPTLNGLYKKIMVIACRNQATFLAFRDQLITSLGTLQRIETTAIDDDEEEKEDIPINTEEVIVNPHPITGRAKASVSGNILGQKRGVECSSCGQTGHIARNKSCPKFNEYKKQKRAKEILEERTITIIVDE